MIRPILPILALLYFISGYSQESSRHLEILPRTILALYDSRFEKTPEETFLHLLCEMPLNYLGMDLTYHDLQQPLPDLSQAPHICGIVTCFPHEMFMDDPVGFLQWAGRAIDLGKKYVILQDPGFKRNGSKELTSSALINQFYKKLGFYDRSDWTPYTFHYEIVQLDPHLVQFEHPYPAPLPPFSTVEILSPEVKSFLTVAQSHDQELHADLVLAGPHGGYVAEYYASTYTKSAQAAEARYWYINPFEFFRVALGLDQQPIPETTTLAGRRIFYSQINGDAWNTLTEIENYKRNRALCSSVLCKEILTSYPELPFSVGIIAADVDPDWVANKTSQSVAKEILALENVEAASHTYSHPFLWTFFEDPMQQEREIDYLHLYPYGSWQGSYLSWLRSAYDFQRGRIFIHEKSLGIGYVTPRAYGNHPFDLTNEIVHSCSFIEQLAPSTKKVSLLQWSGDCLPWEEAVEMTRVHGLKNINGGSIRKDADYPSYCNVGPLGRKVGSATQIYASANDEDDYTYDWTGRFYGYKYVIETFKNTDLPFRIKPINLNFHMYSAQKTASLNALKANLEYISQQEIIPLWPSRYAEIAEGFYTTQIVKLAPRQWKILERGEMQTIRFDRPQYSIDYASSKGIIGHRELHNSLYVYLDSAAKEPLITLAPHVHPHPYLVESRWEIWDLRVADEAIYFKTKGWGPLEMGWFLPWNSPVILKTHGIQGAEIIVESLGHQSLFHFKVDAPSNHTLEIEIRPQRSINGGQ